ncbi:reverse gyrase [Fervidicoccus fontis]|uniref:Reverse gyrase n=1 Tax=Fervidicoccus fontis TaxID=683846 RepID=A0A2J6N5D7_9CREN|nr:reverse gyrase [Fervidicoccus fontis]PMB75819.1 MAG: reverse gyrase [Fervidicoccus fontis]PMB76538.1 MAG: reverse gyrase [Fervidicoccus fontis]HEW63858.1 reverse gyrase [Fervidicoccus fontis]
MQQVKGIYIRSCPNCGGPVSDLRLSKGLACERCLPDINEELDFERLLLKLKEEGSLKELKKYYNMEEMLKEFVDMFEKALRNPPWSAQITWAKRVFLNKSFSIVAPTGVGKTVFGMITALFFSKHKEKSMIVLPTRALVSQVCEKLERFKETLEIDAKILCSSMLRAGIKSEVLEMLSKGDFDIFVCTSKFMIRNSSILKRAGFRFFFVDDVDSVLKSGKSIESLFNAMGFSSEAINLVLEISRLRSLAMRAQEDNKSEKLRKELNEKLEKLKKEKEKIGAVLVVSSATGSPKGRKISLFKELLGFQVGTKTEQLRNVVDTYKVVSDEDLEKELVSLVKKLGSGGLVFVPSDMGTEYAKKIADLLNYIGIKSEAISSKNIRSIKSFETGEIDVLVGVSIYYGILVRGLDLPHRVRYVIFAGLPRFKFTLQLENIHPLNVLTILSLLSKANIKDVSEQAKVYLKNIRRILRSLSPAAIQIIANKLIEGKIENDIDRAFMESIQFLKNSLKREDVKNYLLSTNEVFVRKEGEKFFIYVPDIKSYIQASGRCSRLYAGGLTKGLAITLVPKSENRLFEIFQRTARIYIESADIKPLEIIDLNQVLKEIDEDRKKVLKIIEGKFEGEKLDLVKSALMIVESPNKAKTISNFFGRPSVRILGENLKAYEVSIGNLMLLITSSGGHIVDVVTNANDNELKAYSGLKKELYGILYDEKRKTFVPVYSTIKKCLNCGNQFSDEIDRCPRCGSREIKDSRNVINALRDLATEVDKVLIATDPDTEGEKIGWDISVLLRPFTQNIKRVLFHEVTRRAILKALSEEKLIDEKLVDAQITRRVEDRWIGFSLSQKLQKDFWKEYCMKYVKNESRCSENKNLSAGRVQTPVLGWIIERYHDHLKSEKTIISIQAKNGGLIELSFAKEDYNRELDLDALKEKKVIVKVVKEEDAEVFPRPPFTTDTLLIESNKVLGLSASRTMQLAQDLFEAGLITYHRTDSIRVSTTGIEVAKDYIQRNFVDSWEKLFTPRIWGSEGAHEAIRPTRPLSKDDLIKLIDEGEIIVPKPLTRTHFSLYDLIFRRFVASQMKPCVVSKQFIVYEIEGTGIKISEEILTNNIKDKGFLTVYSYLELRQRMKEGSYSIVNVNAIKKRVIQLYTQADLVSKMKERGLGRPSTYATIISKILTRRYALESGKYRKIVPTKLGINVYNYLSANFSKLVSEERTRSLEEKMSRVANGEEDYRNVIEELYREISEIFK